VLISLDTSENQQLEHRNLHSEDSEKGNLGGHNDFVYSVYGGAFGKSRSGVLAKETPGEKGDAMCGKRYIL
jgi:hypothetical protein